MTVRIRYCAIVFSDPFGGDMRRVGGEYKTPRAAKAFLKRQKNLKYRWYTILGCCWFLRNRKVS